MKRKWLAVCMTLCMVLGLTACGSTGSEVTSDEQSISDEAVSEESGDDSLDTSGSGVTNLSKLDNSAWQYNSDDDVYYQIGISYCSNPADVNYETLAVFVPGAYMTGTDNGDGTYTCEINPDGTAGSYNAENAPIVMPINTPGYTAQAALTEYTSVSQYTDAGFVYVHAGCRGRDAGAPAGVTDLKAAIRYIRYCDDVLAGDAESIFTFGMSGGGAQSSVVGSTGDSSLYDAYLEEIGAVEGVSDAVLGSMCWCPITNLDSADEAYEWMMGTTRSNLSDEEQEISDKLAEAFAAYINDAGIKDENGNVLTLEESSDGIYQAGSYYEYMKSVIENSLNNFLSDTTFPYDASSAGNNGGGPGGDFGGRGGRMKGNFDGNSDGNGGPKGNFGGPDGNFDGDFGGPDGEFDGNFKGGKGGPGGMRDGSFDESELPDDLKQKLDEGNTVNNSQDSTGAETDGALQGGEADVDNGEQDKNKAFVDGNADGNTADGGTGNIEDFDNITRNQTDSGISLSGTYETAQDYIDALNANGEWVTYDEASNTATITSIADFVKAFKSVSKNLGAFDQLDGGQGENTLFGYGDGSGAHFDSVLADILNSLGSSYASDYSEDLSKTDSVGNTVDTRLNMYTPLYYLLESSEGYGTSTVAKYWRIRTGIAQSDCALSTEMNLALALENTESVKDVDFETVWGAGHTKAERTGDSTTNFIEWVNECMNK
ncbi:MAG: tannase [Lachnospiraceae bacterium]|nr:tannase [Lachnospiraceae bacterium]